MQPFLISIHALREEGDAVSGWATRLLLNFNPRPPRGGRRISLLICARRSKFQSTPSARRATCCRVLHVLVTEISIHALREEGDGTRKQQCTGLKSFQSTPSARRATSSDTKQFCSVRNFNPRPPRGGRRVYNHIENTAAIFQSTPSARRATPENPVRTEEIIISIHALREEGDAALPT